MVCSSISAAWRSDISDAIADQIDGQHQQHEADPWDRDDPRRKEHVGFTFSNHQSPRRGRRLHTHAEKGQGGFEQYRVCHFQGSDDNERPTQVGKNFTNQDA
ncbi:hypothetical protein KPSA1_04981 [Pseudomonas syringae pv. actinidiae]|uniref:Uncharacterized protein n=1 Tax=Pseudomonas syringae pv. actinidiae TaxID=103796 RepID=A0A2V0QSD5_PSESF|nr:hypothetical protein KPSA1_04981 [Pseudomonas syringae pv. actinidiae]